MSQTIEEMEQTLKQGVKLNTLDQSQKDLCLEIAYGAAVYLYFVNIGVVDKPVALEVNTRVYYVDKDTAFYQSKNGKHTKYKLESTAQVVEYILKPTEKSRKVKLYIDPPVRKEEDDGK